MAKAKTGAGISGSALSGCWERGAVDNDELGADHDRWRRGRDWIAIQRFDESILGGNARRRQRTAGRGKGRASSRRTSKAVLRDGKELGPRGEGRGAKRTTDWASPAYVCSVVGAEAVKTAGKPRIKARGLCMSVGWHVLWC